MDRKSSGYKLLSTVNGQVLVPTDDLKEVLTFGDRILDVIDTAPKHLKYTGSYWGTHPRNPNSVSADACQAGSDRTAYPLISSRWKLPQ